MSARDGYREYYSEKLWEWIPSVYRENDAANGNALRAFVRALAAQAAVLKRSQDRLWDDQSIELADDWAIPYVADLLGTRLVSALNPRARRADVAKTIYYRRRKGTVAVLEQLIADMTGWDGKVVEEFRRLARLRHGLDGIARLGRITHTPEGGLADLRSVRGALLTGSAFDEFHSLPDMRRPAGALGLRGICKLTFHLHTLHSVEFDGVWPRSIRALPGNREAFTFDPSGREVPLFAANDPNRNWTRWQTAAEWELPRRLTCRLLGEKIFEIGDEEIAWIEADAPIATLAERQAAVADLRKIIGRRFADAERLTRVLRGMPSGATLTTAGVLAGLLQRGLVDDCGSAALLPKALAPGEAAVTTPAVEVSFAGGATQYRDRTSAANFGNWNAVGWTPPALANVDLYVEPDRGRMVLAPQGNASNTVRARYRVGMRSPIGAGAFARDRNDITPTVLWQNGSSATGTPAAGVVRIDDSGTYVDPSDQVSITDCTIFAREAKRPYIRLTDNWQLAASGDDRHLVLDGLWIGARPTGDLQLGGNYERVHLRFCTLDPGGIDALGDTLPAVELVVTGFIEELEIERCVLANIRLQGAGASSERLIISDSIIHARDAGVTAIAAPRSHLTLVRSTVVGPTIGALTVDVERIDATDSLIAGVVDVTDTQSGCFRFSARAEGSRVPHPFRSHTLEEIQRLFVSRRFGDPEYMDLSPRAGDELLTGSEEGGHLGAHCAERAPIKQDSLRTKVEEYLPFGRLPHFLVDN